MFRFDPAAFDGPYRDCFIEFLSIKEMQGCSLKPQLYALASINRFLVEERGHADATVTEEDVREWVSRGSTSGGREQRFSRITAFCTFLASRGHDAYIGDARMYRGGVPFSARILDDAELAAFFAAADGMRSMGQTYDHPVLFPTACRLLYGCGLRIGEATGLRIDDIDFCTGRIDIIGGKNGDSRVVYAPDSLMEAIERYASTLSAVRGEGFLLRGCDGRAYSRPSAEKAMRIVRAAAGLDGGGRQPLRLHDLRHNFAVRAMEKMSAEGMDVYAAMPYLCRYMGHADIRETEYYIRLAPRGHARISAMAESFAEGIVPTIEEER